MTPNFIDRIKLPFRKEKELFVALYKILGFYPHNISYYKTALMHKSLMMRNEKGRPLNNERLEFLGDAILDAIVGDIVYRHFEGKREGFLTNTRSKIVQRETLGRLAHEVGLDQLIRSAGHSNSHNSYMAGNAFEALVGAVYLDRGYALCMRFMENRILKQLINIDKVAYKEVNFKSKLIEWSQKNRVILDFELVKQEKDNKGNPVFVYAAVIEGLKAATGKGFSKKESQQLAAKETLEMLKRQPQFIDAVFAAKGDRTKMEEEPVMSVPDTEQRPDDFIISTTDDKHFAPETTADKPKKDAPHNDKERKEPKRQAKRENKEKGADSKADRPKSKGNENKTKGEEAKPKANEDKAKGEETAPTQKPRRRNRRKQEEAEDDTPVEVYRNKTRSEVSKPKDDETAAKKAADYQEFDLSDITSQPKELDREEIIAAAEAAAFEA